MRRVCDRVRRGAALVETALVLIIFLTLFFAIFDFGRAFFAYLAINGAATIASDFGTKGDSSSQSGYPSSAAVANQAKAAYGPAIDPNLATVTVDTNATLDGHPALNVTVGYSYPLISPFLGFAFSGNIVTLTSTAVRLYP